MDEIAGKVAAVTGGGRGIGRAIAVALAGAGVRVAITGRSADVLEQVCAEISAHGGEAAAFPGDVADAAAVRNTFARIRATLGPVDILVNNAGMTASVKFTDMDDALWEQIMRVNATGPYLCCKATVPHMIEQKWGRIINIASIAALSGLPYSVAYSASKHALLGLTRSLALELGRYGITSNAICPGWTDTDMLHNAVANIVEKTGRSEDEARASVLALSKQPRVIAPEEVAKIALELVSRAGANRNGEAIVLDGTADEN
jgi:NAD(P)-dependent dehydrogenase (short-subunit alcohol dehydrogenase family)